MESMAIHFRRMATRQFEDGLEEKSLPRKRRGAASSCIVTPRAYNPKLTQVHISHRVGKRDQKSLNSFARYISQKQMKINEKGKG
jgi:hypothetical protein